MPSSHRLLIISSNTNLPEPFCNFVVSARAVVSLLILLISENPIGIACGKGFAIEEIYTPKEYIGYRVACYTASYFLDVSVDAVATMLAGGAE